MPADGPGSRGLAARITSTINPGAAGRMHVRELRPPYCIHACMMACELAGRTDGGVQVFGQRPELRRADAAAVAA